MEKIQKPIGNKKRNLKGDDLKIIPDSLALTTINSSPIVGDPHEIVTKATVFANELAKVIESQRLYTEIKGKKYVHVDAWIALGNMLGVYPQEEYVKELDDGSFEAKINIISAKTGKILASSSSMCGMDENTWKSRNRFARRSMAITRATGKAFRIAFSWILTLRGYAPTPFEEMPAELLNDNKLETYFTSLLNLTDKIKDDEQKESIIAVLFEHKNNFEFLKKSEKRIKEIIK